MISTIILRVKCKNNTHLLSNLKDNPHLSRIRYQLFRAILSLEDFSSHNIPEEKRTVLVLRASSGFVKAKSSKGTILGEMLMDLGCINIADSDKNLLQNLSAESVIFRNPYHIFVTTMGNDTEAAITRLSKMIKENPAWSEVDAVKENRIHFMDKKLFNLKPNSRWAEAYEQLCEILK